jgi:hypothetical protein
MIIERLSREHRNIEMLLAVLERELEIFDRGGRPDYEVVRAPARMDEENFNPFADAAVHQNASTVVRHGLAVRVSRQTLS